MRDRIRDRRLPWNPIVLGCVLAVGTLAFAQEADEPDAKKADDTPKKAQASQEPTAPSTDEGLRVRSITLASGYEEGEPVGETESFATGRIFAIIDVENGTGGPSEIRVAWVPEGKKGWKGMRLEVPDQARYRTVAMTWATPREPGAYKVVVRDTEGDTLAEKTFRIAR